MDIRLNNAPCGFLALTHEGIIEEINETFLGWLGFTRGNLVGKHIEVLMSATSKLMFHSHFFPNINLTNFVEEFFIYLQAKDGQSIPFLLNGHRYERDGREVVDCIFMKMKKRIDYELELRTAKQHLQDAYIEKERALDRLNELHIEIEEKHIELLEINANLLELSVTDKLTGLKNRRYFHKKLQLQIDLHRNTDIIFSMCMIDIDFFKKVNDTYGHQVGDEILTGVATLLNRNCRRGDIVARFGGEEFVLIFPHTRVDQAKERAETIRQAVENFEWSIGTVTISVGIATFSSGETEQTIIEKADRALYASKKRGRNCITHSSELTDNPLLPKE